jgi:YhcN/YlaJ family sporulation lipoprotein
MHPWKVIRKGLFVLMAILLITACAPNDTQDNQQNGQQESQPFQGQNENRNVDQNNQDQVLEDFDREEAQKTAERLAELATRVEEVNDATAVVIGPWAVVGIDVDASYDRGRVGNIKYSVAEALKEDPAGAYAVVTADPDTMQRLREMRAAIENGEPVEGIMNELAEMVGRLMPQIPREVETPKSAPEQKHNIDEAEKSRDINRLEQS